MYIRRKISRYKLNYNNKNTFRTDAWFLRLSCFCRKYKENGRLWLELEKKTLMQIFVHFETKFKSIDEVVPNAFVIYVDCQQW